jgi:hypothetical protein
LPKPYSLPFAHYPFYDFGLRATHALTLLPAALASVSFGFVFVRVRVPFALQLAQGSPQFFSAAALHHNLSKSYYQIRNLA